MQTGNIVVSPVTGTISNIKGGRIRIFLSDVDDHTIYSPVTGKITKVKLENGRWKRKVTSI